MRTERIAGSTGRTRHQWHNGRIGTMDYLVTVYYQERSHKHPQVERGHNRAKYLRKVNSVGGSTRLLARDVAP